MPRGTLGKQRCEMNPTLDMAPDGNVRQTAEKVVIPTVVRN